MKQYTRKIEVEIQTDETGIFCNHLCPFAIGSHCEAFLVERKRVEGTSLFRRPSRCIDAEYANNYTHPQAIMDSAKKAIAKAEGGKLSK